MAKASTNAKPTRGFRIWPFTRKETFARRFERYPCCVVGVLHMADRGYDMDGVVLEVSEGGVLFRAASQFIMERPDERVIVFFDTIEAPGTIVNARSMGYGVKLDDRVDVMDIRRIAALYNHDQARRTGFANQPGPEREAAEATR